MKKIYITFSGDKYHSMTEKIVTNAPQHGADEVWVYDDVWLISHRPFFVESNKALFAHQKMRGFGWFCWKPLVVLAALARAQIGDIVLFTDADTYPIADLNPLYRQCEKDGGIMLFSAVGHKQRQWCKHDCMHLMEMDDDHWRDKQHAVARFYLFQKGAEIQMKPTGWYPHGASVTPEQFLNEWQKYVSDIRCNTFDLSTILPEYDDLKEHRCEQAILTNLAHRYGFKLYREACGYGEGYEEDRDLYQQVFVQEGWHSFDPHRPGRGSSFRNVND